jgi:hypothetical protein
MWGRGVALLPWGGQLRRPRPAASLVFAADYRIRGSVSTAISLNWWPQPRSHASGPCQNHWGLAFIVAAMIRLTSPETACRPSRKGSAANIQRSRPPAPQPDVAALVAPRRHGSRAETRSPRGGPPLKPGKPYRPLVPPASHPTKWRTTTTIPAHAPRLNATADQRMIPRATRAALRKVAVGNKLGVSKRVQSTHSGAGENRTKRHR